MARCGARHTLIRPQTGAMTHSYNHLVLLCFGSELKGRKNTSCPKFCDTSVRFRPPPLSRTARRPPPARLWHPRCLHSSCVSILCIMCLICLKRDFFCKYKGYMCNYDFMQGPFYTYIWIGCGIIAFVEGVFAKCSVIIAWQENFHFSLSLKWIYIEKDKIPWNSKSLLCFPK